MNHKVPLLVFFFFSCVLLGMEQPIEITVVCKNEQKLSVNRGILLNSATFKAWENDCEVSSLVQFHIPDLDKTDFVAWIAYLNQKSKQAYLQSQSRENLLQIATAAHYLEDEKSLQASIEALLRTLPELTSFQEVYDSLDHGLKRAIRNQLQKKMKENGTYFVYITATTKIDSPPNAVYWKHENGQPLFLHNTAEGLRRYSAKKSELLISSVNKFPPVSPLMVHPHGKLAATWLQYAPYTVYDLENKISVNLQQENELAPFSLSGSHAWHPKQNLLAVTTSQYCLPSAPGVCTLPVPPRFIIFDYDNKTIQSTGYLEHHNNCLPVCFSADGQFFITSDRGTVTLWDISAAQATIHNKITLPTIEFITALHGIEADGIQLLLCAHEQGTISLIDLEGRGSTIIISEFHGRKISHISSDADGTVYFSVENDGLYHFSKKQLYCPDDITTLCKNAFKTDEDRIGIAQFFWHGMKYISFYPLTKNNKGILDMPHKYAKRCAFYAGSATTVALYATLCYCMKQNIEKAINLLT